MLGGRGGGRAPLAPDFFGGIDPGTVDRERLHLKSSETSTLVAALR
jgi:hypothetical protein